MAGATLLQHLKKIYCHGMDLSPQMPMELSIAPWTCWKIHGFWRFLMLKLPFPCPFKHIQTSKLCCPMKFPFHSHEFPWNLHFAAIPWSIPMVPMVPMVPMAPDAATLLLTEGGAKGTARGLGHLGQDMADGDATTQPRDITYII